MNKFFRFTKRKMAYVKPMDIFTGCCLWMMSIAVFMLIGIVVGVPLAYMDFFAGLAKSSMIIMIVVVLTWCSVAIYTPVMEWFRETKASLIRLVREYREFK